MALVLTYVSHECGLTDKGVPAVALRVLYREAGAPKENGAPGEIRLYFSGEGARVSADKLRAFGWDGSKGKALNGVGSKEVEGYWREEYDDNGRPRTTLDISTRKPLAPVSEKAWEAALGGAR